MDEEVQFTDEQWEAVATAAEAFAAVLVAARADLAGVLRSNWAGACAEGEATMENLQSLLRGDSASFSNALVGESDYLSAVALRCRAAKGALNTVDENNLKSFER